jgi:hypothetical protein
MMILFCHCIVLLQTFVSDASPSLSKSKVLSSEGSTSGVPSPVTQVKGKAQQGRVSQLLPHSRTCLFLMWLVEEIKLPLCLVFTTNVKFAILTHLLQGLTLYKDKAQTALFKDPVRTTL